ncbi:molybdopterin synthase sulfur carrier subunit [Ahniella affigens]|uniref:Molybdopterin synthase sulfur carrier subunit n=1 Tax=Ahniella affigens TaxID=2021234 RepID=A0A2P1PYV4_9GAMM|nr:molybdopterin synthase sulfur carrier subunit [Ahniella affigens]
MRVGIPSPLQSYTGATEVTAQGHDLEALLADLDRQFPGIRFRMLDEQRCLRRHIRVFVNGRQTFSLSEALQPGDHVAIVQALSGG